MKNLFIMLILYFVLISSAFTQKLVTIRGEGFKTFDHVTLKVYSHTDPGYEPIEKLAINSDGSFTFQLPFSGDNLYELNFDEKDFVHLSVPEEATIYVAKVNGKVTIEGSPNSVKMQKFHKKNRDLQAKYFGNLKAEMDKAMREGNQERIEEIQHEADVAVQNFLMEFRTLIISMGTNSAGLYALQYTDFNKELGFVEERLAAFKNEAPGSVPTKALEKLVYQTRHTAIGKIPPDFSTVDMKGNMVSLDQFKGFIVLIDFWAYWCRACRVENPKFAVLYDSYKAEGFHILSITQDAEKSSWQKAIEKDGIQAFQHIFDTGNRINDLFSISSLPQNLLLDKDGKIIAKNITADELEKILKEM